MNKENGSYYDPRLQSRLEDAARKQTAQTHRNESVFALKQLLEYAKYLEDNNRLSYALLKARVETYEKGE